MKNTTHYTVSKWAAILLIISLPHLIRADQRAQQLITGSGGSFELGKAVPGLIDIETDAAFAILQTNEGGIVGVCAAAGKGRVAGFTHGGFLKPGAILQQAGAAKLLCNSLRWTGRSSTPAVALHPELAGLIELLAENNIPGQTVPIAELERSSNSVYCLIGHSNFTDEEIAAIKRFIQSGGGLVVATTPWAFKKKYDEFTSFPGNRLVSDAGFQFLPDGYARGKTLSYGTSQPQMSDSSSGTPGVNSTGAELRIVQQLIEDRSSVSASEWNQAFAQAKKLRGKDLSAFLAGLLQLNKSLGPIVPTRENPVIPGQDKLVDAVIELETWFNEHAPAGVMYAIPAAENYPGAVPEDAERCTRSFAMNGTYKGWLQGRLAGGWAAKEMRPTGVYAAPGEVITVTLPAQLAGEGFEVVIGSYNGHLRNRDKWFRYPDWQTRAPVTGRITEASNGLGGLVTIRIPREADYEQIDITIEGGVRAPYYEHGKTDVETWIREVRRYPAPWAELASERMIIALPSEYIRRITDPDDIMETWNDIIDTAAELVQVDRNDYRAERIVFDRQTSAGAMHSSYPVAAHLGPSAEQAVDSTSLRKEGNWGFFHEYGHNHQHNLWALPGTVETTCNLWSVYIYEQLIGTHRDKTHRAIQPLNRKQRVNTYFRNGAPFQEEWSVWTALETYLMIQEEFGWEPFKKVFHEYNKLEQEEWPRGQQEINDQWVIRLSRACGRNLQPFWAAWNLPMTTTVERELRDLPRWDDHPVKRFVSNP